MRRRNRNRREARECGGEVEASTDSSGTGDEWHVRLGGIKERKRRNKEVMEKFFEDRDLRRSLQDEME